MSSRTRYPRKAKRQVRKPAIDDNTNEIPLDPDFFPTNVPETTRTEVGEYVDSFGEPITPVKSGTKCVKKKPVSKKKKPPKELRTSPICMPQRSFIPSPKIIQQMKEAQAELYSVMGINQSPCDISTTSKDSLNVSGIQSLPDTPTPSTENKSVINLTNDEKNEPPIFKGVNAFVDHKTHNGDHAGIGIVQRLREMGAKVEKTLNRKVTHVVFCDGYLKTYKTAIQRSIPLVSAKWVEQSIRANKILDPVDYPPVNIEKYKRRSMILTVPRRKNYKCLSASSYLREEQLTAKCNDLMERIKKYQMDFFSEKKEIGDINEASQKPEFLKEPDDGYPTNDLIGLLSDNLINIVNTVDSPEQDEEIDERYVPASIKILRKHLTPQGKEEKSTTELDNDILKIEDRLKLNSKARQRFRKLLFPLDKELNNMSVVRDFPSPSPQKLKISAPARLILTKKKRRVSNKNHDKSCVNSDDKKSPQQIMTIKNKLQRQIPTDLHPKKVKKIDIKNNKDVKRTLTQETIPNVFSRNSTMIFQTPKVSVAGSLEVQSIAFTGLSKSEEDIMKLSIQNLGTFLFHSKVESSTTFLVTKSQPYRTLNMVFAMAFGCLIISDEWVHKSHEVGRWLPYQQFLIQSLSDPVKEFQTLRQTGALLLTFHIFNDAGIIYIADICEPSAKDLKQLVHSCGGQCTNNETMADVVVGSTIRMNNNINEKWIFDCISQGKLLDTHPYRLVNHNIT